MEGHDSRIFLTLVEQMGQQRLPLPTGNTECALRAKEDVPAPGHRMAFALRFPRRTEAPLGQRPAVTGQRPADVLSAAPSPAVGRDAYRPRQHQDPCQAAARAPRTNLRCQ